MKPYVFFVALLIPASSFAQSPASQYSSVVSIQQLAMPRKAARALEKGTALLLKNSPQASISYFQTAIALAPDSFHASLATNWHLSLATVPSVLARQEYCVGR